MMERTEYKKLLGQKTRALRKEKGLIQADLAEKLGVTQEYLGKIERGLASPSFPLLLDLARVLDVEPAALLSTVPPPRTEPAGAELGLRETRHRMRNCFQFLANLVNLELERASGEETRRVLRELAARIRCLSLVESRLSGDDGHQPLDLGTKLLKVWEAVSRLYPAPAVAVEHRVQPMLVPPDTARACTLVLTEFLTNMYKHAFPGRDAGTFRLDLSRDEDAVRLVLADDGVGLPPGFTAGAPGTMGLLLMRSYVEHALGGSMRLEGQGGVTLAVTFPLPRA